MNMYCLPVYTVFNQIIVTLGLRTTSKRFMILEKKIQNYWSFLIKITSDFIPKKIVSGHFYETRSEIWFEILVRSVVPTKLVQFVVWTKLVRSVGRRFGPHFPYRSALENNRNENKVWVALKRADLFLWIFLIIHRFLNCWIFDHSTTVQCSSLNNLDLENLICLIGATNWNSSNVENFGMGSVGGL